MSKTTKLSCNIIKDLLPSYLEDLCTADTKHAVEEHLSECSTCKNLADVMRQTDFVAERSESAQIDYMKKVKRHFIKKGSYVSIALAAFVLLGLVTSMSSHIQRPIELYYVFLPFLLVITKALLPAPLSDPKIKKYKKRTAVCILLTGYGVVLLLLLLSQLPSYITQGHGPFGIKIEAIGPITHWQIYLILCYHTAMYINDIYQSMRGKPVPFFHMSVYLTCGFILLSEALFSKNLSDPAHAYYALLKPICIFLLEGIVLTGLLLIPKKGLVDKPKV